MATTPLGDFDFGFTAMSEEELKAAENQIIQSAQEKTAELEEATKTYEEKLNTLYKMVMPLLNNLAKDSDRAYIYWPDRHKKMTEFITKVNALMDQ